MEMLFGYLEEEGLKELPVLGFIEKHILPLKMEGVRWGYEIPYLLTGQSKIHPSKAIRFIEEGSTNISNLYAQIAMGR